MLDQKIKSRLLSLLRLGASDQIHEADTALSKAVQMMEKHGITIDDLLDQIGASELPQSVCADLARRYCLTRPDMGPTARDEYYRAVFLRIAERYAPEAKLTNTKKPTASPESGGQAGKRGRSDWKSRMDDTRRASAGNRHEQTREEASQQYRRYSPPPRSHSTDRDPEESFLSATLRNPAQTARLFFVCCLYALPRGFVACILLAGGLREADIHFLDSVHWIDALSVVSFPFMIWKGHKLVSDGWFSG
jgi:hypothetical protein